MILHIDQRVTMCDHRWLYTPFRLNCAFTLYIFIYIIRTTLRGGCHPPPFSRRNLRHIYGRPHQSIDLSIYLIYLSIYAIYLSIYLCYLSMLSIYVIYLCYLSMLSIYVIHLCYLYMLSIYVIYICYLCYLCMFSIYVFFLCYLSMLSIYD